MHDFCCFLWKLAITFPGKIFDLYDDDVSGAFTQLVFHPDVARANVSSYSNTMIASAACHFGGNFGPASWEPVARARCSLAKWLFMHAVYYKELNQESLTLFELPSGNRATDGCKVFPKQCKFHGKVVDENGNFTPEFKMFVDNLLAAIPRHLEQTEQLKAACLESVYLLLGYPGPIKKPIMPPTMAFDKMEERPIGIERVSLGTRFRSNLLCIEAEDHKVERLLNMIITSWNKGINRFLPITAAKLQGNVIYATQHNMALRWSMHHIVEEMRKTLAIARIRLARSKHFQKLLGEADEAWLDAAKGKKFAKRILPNASLANKVWRQRVYGNISPSMRKEIEWIKDQCTDHLSGKRRWTRHISQIIKRELDGNIAQDASTSWGMGGFSTLGFYWQYSWEELIPDKIADIRSKQLSINVLELVAIVVNFFATATYSIYTLRQEGGHLRYTAEAITARRTVGTKDLQTQT